MEIPGLQLKGRSGQPSVFQHDADVTLNSLVNTGTSAFLKIGTGKLHLKGTDTLTVNTYVNNSGAGLRSTVFPNGDGPTKAFRGFSISAGTFEMGVVDDPANAPTLVIGNTEIGVGNPTSTKNGSATFILNNGTITLTKVLYVCYYSTAGNMLTFRQDGSLVVGSGTATVGVLAGDGLVYGGDLAVPGTLRLRPASKLAQSGLTGKTSVVDGLLYVRISAGGTTVILR